MTKGKKNRLRTILLGANVLRLKLFKKKTNRYLKLKERIYLL